MRCPNCGAEFEADERYGHYVTCGYCSSQIVLDKESLAIAGRMAALGLPRGPLSLHATGSIGGRGFQVIGRVRYGYRAGFWDEWHLRWEDGSTGWISQDEDRLVLEELTDFEAADPGDVEPGQQLDLKGIQLRVREQGRAKQEGAEGQLPFAVNSDEEIRYIDLFGEKRHATLEGDDEGWRLFVGRRLKPSAIILDHPFDPQSTDSLRGERAGSATERKIVQRRSGRELALSCEACGASLGVPERGTEEVSCESCGAEVDLACERVACPDCETGVPLRSGTEAAQLSCPGCHKQLRLEGEVVEALESLADRKRPKFPVALGQRFHYEGVDYRIIALIQWFQLEEGTRYYWRDFLLFAPEQGYRWLGEENGHWMLFDDIEEGTENLNRAQGKRRSKFYFAEREWRVFERGKMHAGWVEGELPWALAIGDSYGFLDTVSAPYMLSAEWDDNEIGWSRGVYLDHATIAAALGVTERSLPRKKGIGPAQPYVGNEFRRRSGPIVATFLVLILGLLLWSCSEGQRSEKVIRVSKAEYSQEFVTEAFFVGKAPALYTLEFEAPLDNAWVYLDAALLDDEDRPVHEFSAEMSYYHGREGGESWSEGRRSDAISFKIDETGYYRLLLLGQSGRGETNEPESLAPMYTVSISLVQDIVLSRYFVILAGLASLWLLIVYLPRLIFESQRWSDD